MTSRAAVQRSWAVALAVTALSVSAAFLLDDARGERAARLAIERAAAGSTELRDEVVAVLTRVNDPLTPAPVVQADELPDVPEVAAAAASARDTARPRLTEPFELGGTPVLVALSPRYSGSVPSSTTQRRDTLSGYVAEQVVLGPIVDGAFAGVTVRISDAGTAFAVTDGEGDAVDTLPLAMGGRSWVIEVVAPSATGLAPFLIIVGGLAGAVAIVVSSRRTERTRRAAEAEARASAAQSNLVVDAGSMLHRSLDLGEVLPGLGLQLVDAFDLTGLQILVSGEDGRLDPAFTMGTVDGAAHHHEVPLERHSRTVGALRLASRDPLNERQRSTLRAIGELAASAIANVQAYEDEQETVRRLAELDELKTNFLATVSHELSTPVTAIKGFSSLLSTSWEKIPEDQRRDQIERIARNASSLGELVRGLLEFARMERRSLHVEREDHDLSALVTSIVNQTVSLLDDHEVIIDAAAPVPASVDPYGVERIVANLLTNAGKFSPPGTEIRVGVRQGPGTAVLTVSDRGPGIPLEERAHIFSRFYRGTSQHAVRTRGAGVGLAVVRELVDRMGATVTIGDTAGGGATFTVEFVGAAATNGSQP